MKECKHCKIKKDTSRFSKNKRNLDGLRYICKNCDKIIRDRHYNKNKNEILKTQREKHKNNRVEILKYYSNGNPRCACCDETALQFLAIDHIKGGGNKHKQKLKRRGTEFAHWLIKNNFPKGFQILCHNCNMAKGFYGFCPHLEKRVEKMENWIDKWETYDSGWRK